MKIRKSFKLISVFIAAFAVTGLVGFGYYTANEKYENIKTIEIKEGQSFLDCGVQIDFSNVRICKMSDLAEKYQISNMDMMSNEWKETDRFILIDFVAKNISEESKEVNFEELQLQSGLNSNADDMCLTDLMNNGKASLNTTLEPEAVQTMTLAYSYINDFNYKDSKMIFLKYPYKVEMKISVE